MVPVIVLRGIGICLRLLIINSQIQKFFMDRVEIVTPANSFRRVLEGIKLHREGLSPYAGNVFHEDSTNAARTRTLDGQSELSKRAGKDDTSSEGILTVWKLVIAKSCYTLFISFFWDIIFGQPGTKLMPFVLYSFSWMTAVLGSFFPVAVVIVDVLTAWLLGRTAYVYVTKLKPAESRKYESAVSFLVELCYLFNPFIVFSCVAQTTSVLQNFLLGLTLWAVVSNMKITCLICLALASYQGLYPSILSIAVALKFAQDIKRNGFWWWVEFWKTSAIFLLLWVSLLYLSSVAYGSWSFLEHTYGFLVSVPDLTPNVGLFWYFFTEMFDHFQLFFLWVFQVNLLVYLAPMALCLRDDPVLLYNEFLMLIAVFKSYPSVADAGLYLSLLPAWSHLFKFVRHGFIVCCAVICCAILAPVMWFLWIYSGSANANFYFAITLVYATAQIFLLTDLLYAHLRRQVHSKYGLEPQIAGEKAKIVLQ